MFNDERNRLQPDVASASNSFGRDLKNTKESREIIKKIKEPKQMKAKVRPSRAGMSLEIRQDSHPSAIIRSIVIYIVS